MDMYLAYKWIKPEKFTFSKKLCMKLFFAGGASSSFSASADVLVLLSLAKSCPSKDSILSSWLRLILSSEKGIRLNLGSSSVATAPEKLPSGLGNRWLMQHNRWSLNSHCDVSVFKKCWSCLTTTSICDIDVFFSVDIIIVASSKGWRHSAAFLMSSRLVSGMTRSVLPRFSNAKLTAPWSSWYRLSIIKVEFQRVSTSWHSLCWGNPRSVMVVVSFAVAFEFLWK